MERDVESATTGIYLSPCSPQVFHLQCASVFGMSVSRSPQVSSTARAAGYVQSAKHFTHAT